MSLVRGVWAGEEGLQQMHTAPSAPGSRGKSLLQEEEPLLATKPVAGLCPLSCCLHGDGAWRCLLGRAVWRVHKGAGESPCSGVARSSGRRCRGKLGGRAIGSNSKPPPFQTIANTTVSICTVGAVLRELSCNTVGARDWPGASLHGSALLSSLFMLKNAACACSGDNSSLRALPAGYRHIRCSSSFPFPQDAPNLLLPSPTLPDQELTPCSVLSHKLPVLISA